MAKNKKTNIVLHGCPVCGNEVHLNLSHHEMDVESPNTHHRWEATIYCPESGCQFKFRRYNAETRAVAIEKILYAYNLTMRARRKIIF